MCERERRSPLGRKVAILSIEMRSAVSMPRKRNWEIAMIDLKERQEEEMIRKWRRWKGGAERTEQKEVFSLRKQSSKSKR